MDPFKGLTRQLQDGALFVYSFVCFPRAIFLSLATNYMNKLFYFYLFLKQTLPSCVFSGQIVLATES
jgi:hypothetical protein